MSSLEINKNESSPNYIRTNNYCILETCFTFHAYECSVFYINSQLDFMNEVIEFIGFLKCFRIHARNKMNYKCVQLLNL